jgi:hypothetical protein
MLVPPGNVGCLPKLPRTGERCHVGYEKPGTLHPQIDDETDRSSHSLDCQVTPENFRLRETLFDR